MENPDLWNDPKHAQEISKEKKLLDDIVGSFNRLTAGVNDAADLFELSMAEEDWETLEAVGQDVEAIEREVAQLEFKRMFNQPMDSSNCYLEIQAGAGGTEAQDWASMLERMYMRYAERSGWRVEIVSKSDSDLGGYREVICRIIGEGAYSRLKFESGGHRVQRVPETEAQGRVHTSACTVAVMPEADEVEAVKINPQDLRIDVYRASGAGGQHVQKTDSAVRITHLPTGLVVECQDERSQRQNKERAMSVLASRLYAMEVEKRRSEEASTRKSLIGSGDRSERIRTYNYPQGRVTDHRINLTLYKLGAIMDGDLDEILTALQNEHRAELLAAMGENA